MKVLKILIISGCIGLSACTHLTAEERHQIKYLQSNGITVKHPQSDWEKPASPVMAGFLNILPGLGNLYLALGDGADRMQLIYGAFNFFMWPWSVVWGIPEAVIDATTINKRELIYHYKYDRKSPVFNQHFDYNRQHNTSNSQHYNSNRQYDGYNNQQHNYHHQYDDYNTQHYNYNYQYNNSNSQHYNYNRQYDGYNTQYYNYNNQRYDYNSQRYNYRHHDSDYSDYQYFNNNQ